jgi:uncharacterized protein YhaN
MQYLQALRNDLVLGQQRLERSLDTVRYSVTRVERQLEQVEQRLGRLEGGQQQLQNEYVFPILVWPDSIVRLTVQPVNDFCP